MRIVRRSHPSLREPPDRSRTSVSRKLVVGVGERARERAREWAARGPRRAERAPRLVGRSRARSPTPTTSLRETDVSNDRELISRLTGVERCVRANARGRDDLHGRGELGSPRR
jgi:hypothetical protein